MLHLSYPSPPTVPRIEVNGPIRKVFMPDRWNPIHILVDPDTGSPHDHPLSLKANILYGGYVETVWVPTHGGGYTVHYDIARLPGTTHQIDAGTIHLITELPAGISITEAEPKVADRDWFHYDPRADGSIWRSKHHNGPWEQWHGPGPVERVEHGELSVARLAPVAEAYARQQKQKTHWHTEEELPNNFTIGPGNTWLQAADAMLAGHQIRQPHWYKNASWIVESEGHKILRVTGNTKEEWVDTCVVVGNGAIATVEQENWIVLPKIHVEAPTV